MKKLHVLILKTFIGPFLITFVFVTFIFVTQQMVQRLDQLAGKGIPFLTFLELALYFSFNAIPRALPLAVLLSSLMTYGSFGQHNELTAVKSAGISLLRLISPTFLLVLVISASLYIFNNNFLPQLNLKAYSLLYDLTHKKPALELKKGVFYNGIPNYSIKVNEKGENNFIGDIMIYDHSSRQGNSDLILADSGRMYTILGGNYLVLELHNGSRSSEYRSNKRMYEEEFTRTYFNYSKLIFDLSSFSLKRTDQDLFKNNRQVMSGGELKAFSDSVTIMEKEERTELIAGLESKYRYSIKDTMPITQAAITDSMVQVMLANTVSTKEALVLSSALSQARSMKRYIDDKTKYLFNLRKKVIRYTIERLRNYTQSFACIAMFLIGASVGAILKKGGLGIPALITILFFILFYVVEITTEKVARVEGMNVYFAAWSGIITLFPIGVYFLYQARRDASLFEVDNYRKLFTRLKNISLLFAGNKEKN